MADQLTPNAALTLHNADGGDASDGFQPVFQVLHVKKVSGTGPQTDRYRLILSDGAHFIQAMLATQHNHLLESSAVQKNTLVRLTSFALNMVQDRRLVIILGLEPVGQADKIGEPKNVDTASAPAAEAPAPAPKAVVKPEPAQQRPPPAAAKTGGFAASNKAGGSKGGRGNDHGPLYPIEGLSPYQNKCVGVSFPGGAGQGSGGHYASRSSHTHARQLELTSPSLARSSPSGGRSRPA